VCGGGRLVREGTLSLSEAVGLLEEVGLSPRKSE
jgi:hypothetical protein